jgi:hypothetical protein
MLLSLKNFHQHLGNLLGLGKAILLEMFLHMLSSLLEEPLLELGDHQDNLWFLQKISLEYRQSLKNQRIFILRLQPMYSPLM